MPRQAVTSRESSPAPVPVLSHSSMTTVHRTASPALRRALESVPAWVQTMATLTQVNALRLQHGNHAGIDEEVSAVITAGLSAGRKLTLEDLVQQVTGLKAQLDAHTAVGRGLTVAQQQLSNDADTAVKNAADDIFASLDTDLQQVLDEVRKIGPVGSAEQALAVGRGDAWQAFHGLVRSYTDVREAALTLRARLDLEPPTWPEILHLRNPSEVFPNWRAWRRDGYLVDSHSPGSRKTLTAPWPDLKDAEAMLTWLAVTPHAQAWIPGPRQVREGAASLAAELNGEAAPVKLGRVTGGAAPAPEWVERDQPRASRSLGATPRPAW